VARTKTVARDSDFEEVKVRALGLGLEARASLARVLLRSLEDPTEEENERLWLVEAERRQEEVRDGRVVLMDGEEARSLLDRVLG
jgi:Putative addiction module component